MSITKRTILVIGGAGFIGVNAANRFLERGDRVIILDNLSRKGTEINLKWLKERHPDVIFIKGDIRDFKTLQNIFNKYREIDIVLHLAAQVAVTTSVLDPREDFEVNALGTFNLLEAIRLCYELEPSKTNKEAPFFIFASTNKVYGKMDDIKVIESNKRYEFVGMEDGISESRPLDFYSPYGCSKGTADQYVLDYHRIYALDTVSFRQSCIYGYHQFGVEDQGWVAWFLIAATMGKEITIYGNGKQVRDVLFIDDLLDAFEMAIKYRSKVTGKAYNIGGGHQNIISLLELIQFIEELQGRKLFYKFSDARPGDQLVYFSDVRKAKIDFSWEPKIPIEAGVKKLYQWVNENCYLFK